MIEVDIEKKASWTIVWSRKPTVQRLTPMATAPALALPDRLNHRLAWGSQGPALLFLLL